MLKAITMIMRILTFIFVLFICLMKIQAQYDDVYTVRSQRIETSPTQTSGDNLIRVTVPKNMKINDYVIVRNNSPYLILQIAVAKDNGGNNYENIGNATYLQPGKSATIASFSNNKVIQD